MRGFIQFTLQQKVVMNLLFVLLIVVGAFTLLRTPVERYPNINFGKMYVVTYLPGASPGDVETLVTKKIEEGLEDVENIDYIHSSSYRARSSILIKFVDDSDYEKGYDDVRLKVLSLVGELPSSAEAPVFNFLDVNDWFPTISVNIAGAHSNNTLDKVAEELKIPLAQLAGVKEVREKGDFTREFHLIVSPDRLRETGLTFSEVSGALRSANIGVPAGHIRTERGEFIARVDERINGRAELFDIVIRKDGDGSYLRIGDVAEDGYFSYRDPFVMTSVNGLDCVTLQVLKSAEGNALFLTGRVRQIVDEMRPLYEKHGITLTVTQDSSVKIQDSIRVLGVNLLLGIVLVCCIIWLFMGFRNAALTTIGIPFAFLVTIVIMYVTGNSINEVSLFAFVLVSGIIVDDAIVVVENIYRHVQSGKDVMDSVVDGTSEVFLPVVSATLTTVVAFLPMLIMTGMVGDFFSIIPKTIAFALVASLLECLLILPCHYIDFGPRSSGKAGTTFAEREGWLMSVVRSGFNRCILLALRFRITSLLFLGLIFLVAVLMFGSSILGKTDLVRIQFFPDDYSLYYVEVTGPTGTPLVTTHQLIKRIAAKITEEGGGQAESALGFAGFYINEDFSPLFGENIGHVAVTLPSLAKRRFKDFPENDVIVHLETVRDLLQPLIPEGFKLFIRPEKDGPPAGKDLNIRVLGRNSKNVSALAVDLEKFLRSDPEISPWLLDLQDDQGSEVRVFRLRIDAKKAAEWNVSVAEVALLAASILDGQIAGEMDLPDELMDIRLKIGAAGSDPIAAALNTVIKNYPKGALLLGDICTPEFSLEPGYLNRFQSQRAITFTANVKHGAPVTSRMVVEKVKQFYQGVRGRFSGAGLNFAGEYASTQKSFISLAYAFLIAIVIIYMILAAQFKSYLQPLIIISAVIFALTGVIYGTVFFRTLFTINSFIAVIGVTGVVVNDSLVLVEFINSSYSQGRSRQEALLYATHIRLRPILLTTLTTTLGLLPMALGIPEYSLIWGSMAMTFVTGLCTATFLTIIIIPVQWDILAKLNEKIT